MSVLWNGVEIKEIFPTDYNIHTFTAEVKAKAGENIINIAGTGNSDGYGMTIDNVRLIKATKNGEVNLIKNGGFEEGHKVGNGWKIFPNILGW